jgi:hypothetical protein
MLVKHGLGCFSIDEWSNGQESRELGRDEREELTSA